MRPPSRSGHVGACKLVLACSRSPSYLPMQGLGFGAPALLVLSAIETFFESVCQLFRLILHLWLLEQRLGRVKYRARVFDNEPLRSIMNAQPQPGTVRLVVTGLSRPMRAQRCLALAPRCLFVHSTVPMRLLGEIPPSTASKQNPRWRLEGVLLCISGPHPRRWSYHAPPKIWLLTLLAVFFRREPTF